jgi:hypothetical protein
MSKSSNAARAYENVDQLGRIEIGPMLASEHNLVRNSFTEGLADSRGYGPATVKGNAALKARRERHAQLVTAGQEVERLLRRADVLVARDAECESLAYSWICFERALSAVHWASTKSAFRRMGLARLLLKAALPTGARAFSFSTRFDAVGWRHGLTYLPPEGFGRK